MSSPDLMAEITKPEARSKSSVRPLTSFPSIPLAAASWFSVTSDSSWRESWRSDSIERIELSCSRSALVSFGWSGSWLVSSVKMMRRKSSLESSLKRFCDPSRALSTLVAPEIWLMTSRLP
jgi:hypothetical protein